MYAITGITGKVGGALAATLLATGLPVRAVVRDAIRMLDGFNGGWIDFSEHGRSAMKGTTALESVIAELVRASQAKASV
jgi:nucleoside-diphosphate-sugar epimerase